MKPVIAILTALCAALFVLSPLAFAAANTISVSTGASSYSGSQAISIVGTATPAPVSGSQILIEVSNPSSTVVFADSVAPSPTTGAFSDSFGAGGSSAWVTGTYTVTASLTGYTAGTYTFSYTATPSTIPSSYNVTKALVDIQGNLTQIQGKMNKLQKDLNGNFTAQSSATSSMWATLQKDLSGNFSSLSSAITGVSSAVGGLSTGITNIQSSLTSITNTLSSINTAVGNAATDASNAATDASNAQSAISSTTTYVLVVAVLAAITLVLELAILVRKLS